MLQRQDYVPVYFRLISNAYEMVKSFNAKDSILQSNLATFCKEIVSVKSGCVADRGRTQT